MDQNSFIKHVDAVLADLIWTNIKNDSSAATIVSSQEQISFSSPKTASTRGNKKLSIFLYNITEETVAKNLPPSEAGSRKMRSPISFALHYLVTVFTGNDEDDHEVLEKIIQLFLDKPIIDIGEAENNVELAVKLDSLSLNEISKLWIALDTPLRLSMSITVSAAESLHNPQTQIIGAALSSQTPVLDTNHVNQLYKTVLKTFTEQSADWRNRNMFVKQWVFQDFQKNSGITVEEMQSSLNNLGNKLENGESAASFIKPLSQLTGYYQHQLDELKGLHKISHKQTENIEAITAWIEDIKALVEALST